VQQFISFKKCNFGATEWIKIPVHMRDSLRQQRMEKFSPINARTVVKLCLRQCITAVGAPKVILNLLNFQALAQ
jgi:hypothetical protein